MLKGWYQQVVRVMITDDHRLMRQVIREVIEQEEDLEIVAEAGDGYEAEKQAAQTQPDVVLMDLVMPGCDGFEATERVLACAPQARVVIFTASEQEQHVLQAIQRGAVGYLTKDISADALVAAIRRAYQDELCMTRPMAARVLAHLRAAAVNMNTRETVVESEPPMTSMVLPFPPGRGRSTDIVSPRALSTRAYDHGRVLTDREQEVLDLMRQGRRNREIAGELRIAESTVHKHVQNIFEKLHARNRTEAIYLTKGMNG